MIQNLLSKLFHSGERIAYTPSPKRVSNMLLQEGLDAVIPIEYYDDESGLFGTQDSISFILECNPLAGMRNNVDTEQRLLSLISNLPQKTTGQFILFGHPDCSLIYNEYSESRKEAIKNNKIDNSLYEKMAAHRIDRFSANMGEPIFKDRPVSVKVYRLIIVVTAKGDINSPTERHKLLESQELLSSNLSNMGIMNWRILPQTYIDLIFPFLNPHEKIGYSYNYPIYEPSIPIRAQLSPSGIIRRVNKTGIEIFAKDDEKQQSENYDLKMLYVSRYPKTYQLWQMFDIVGSQYDDSMQWPCPFFICLGFEIEDAQVSEMRTNLKYARSAQNAASKMAKHQPELQEIEHDWKVAQFQISSGGQLCTMFHTIGYVCRESLANRFEQIIRNMWRSNGLSVRSVDYLHLPLLVGSLPGCLDSVYLQALKTFGVAYTKTSNTIALTSPVFGEGCGSEHAGLLLLSRAGVPFALDLFDKSGVNYNMFVSGMSGQGKSVFLNEVLSSVRGCGGDGYIIDLGRSYEAQVKLNRGRFIEFSQESKLIINPFSWLGMDKDIPIEEELPLLRPIVARMAYPNSAIPQQANSIISLAILEVYKSYGQDTDITKIASYLQNGWKDEEKSEESANIRQIAYEMGLQLHAYTSKGEYGRFFNGKATLDISGGGLVALELEELKAHAELRTVVLYILTSRIANEMYLTRDKPKVMLLDEAWQSLGEGEESAEFFGEGYRRARKYYGSFIMGTQSIMDAYLYPAARIAYSESQHRIYFAQKPDALSRLKEEKKINFDDGTMKLLMSLRSQPGRFSEFLLQNHLTTKVIRHVPDDFSLMMADSSPTVFSRKKQLLDSGVAPEEVIDTLVREFRRG
jgi:conjugal transfer ATP-binding protein TraC